LDESGDNKIDENEILIKIEKLKIDINKEEDNELDVMRIELEKLMGKNLLFKVYELVLSNVKDVNLD
jgi:hypothetical protein